METTHRIARPIATLVIVLVISTAAAMAGPQPAAAPGELRIPTITYVGDSTPEQRALVEWAADRFAMAGLSLPDVEVSFPLTCGGKRGRHFVGQARIELCKAARITAVHELAHAWDDAGGVADRQGFMHRRGVDHWLVKEGRKPVESGGEQLAQIIAWGLMDLDTAVRYEAYEGQPREDHEPRVPGLPMSSVPELRAEFVELTGVAPLHTSSQL